MTQKNLPGFKTIEFAKSNEIAIESPELIREGSIVPVRGKFTEIPVVDLVGCKVTSEQVSNETIYTTVLTLSVKNREKFTRCQIHDLIQINSCFRLTDIENKKWLLGLDRKPHPILSAQFKSEEKPSGQKVFTVEITYVNTISLIELA